MTSAPDPFEPHLQRAAQLFEAGDIVQAGQIWQAILKRSPNHTVARAGLYKVKLYFDARATQDGLAEAQKMLAPLISPAELDRQLQLGCEHYDADRIQEALAVWMAILAQDPNHALARGYANGARRALGLPVADGEVIMDAPRSTGPLPTPPDVVEAVAVERAAEPVVEPAAVPQPEPLPETPPEAASTEADEDLERLLRDGCTLYDMGQTEEALRKWESLLEHQPDHALARSYVDSARKDLGLEPLAPLPKVAGAAPEAEAAPDLDHLVRTGSQLFDLGMVQEAIDKWEAALALSPDNEEITSYLVMARKELEPRTPRPQPKPAALPQSPAPLAMVVPESVPPMPMEIRTAAPEPELASPPLPEPVHTPSTITGPPAPTRKGLALPPALNGVVLPDWLRTPRTLAMIGGGAVLLVLALMVLMDQKKKLSLKSDIASARAAAMAPVARSVQVPDLGESPEAIRKEAESMLGEDPFWAYCRAQELVRLQSSDAAAAQLLERARMAMAALPAEAGSPKELDRLCQVGDLDGAEHLLRSWLRQDPDSAALRERYGRICQQLAVIYATKENWGEGRDALRRGRAMFPQVKAWRARLFLLEQLQALPKGEREAWLQLLG